MLEAVRIAIACALLLLASSPAAGDVSGKRTAPPTKPAQPAPPKPPCTGCTLDVYGDTAAGAAPMPLLVVLHGDHERAAGIAAHWRAAARQREWALLSLQCPTAEQCKGSWWQWNGDPQWIRDRVSDVAAQVSIDPARTYLAGWSGGATYLGLRAAAWSEIFSAVVVHGGGMAPREDPAPCPPRALPAYFLVGDANPLHSLARELRDHFVQCRQDVQWQLIPGADHRAEDRALDGKRALAILDWLAARPRAASGGKRDEAPTRR